MTRLIPSYGLVVTLMRGGEERDRDAGSSSAVPRNSRRHQIVAIVSDRPRID
jgi:hypothetical protein